MEFQGARVACRFTLNHEKVFKLTQIKMYGRAVNSVYVILFMLFLFSQEMYTPC